MSEYLVMAIESSPSPSAALTTRQERHESLVARAALLSPPDGMCIEVSERCPESTIELYGPIGGDYARFDDVETIQEAELAFSLFTEHGSPLMYESGWKNGERVNSKAFARFADDLLAQTGRA